MKIKYNAPVTLTFSLIAALILLADQTFMNGLTYRFFTLPGDFSFSDFSHYYRLFTHALGHADWTHLIANLSYILLLGPLLEDRLGSAIIAAMIFITALTTGVLNALLFSTGLLGASGVVFMMIILASVVGSNKNEIPLSFILVAVLYLGREISGIFANNSISEFAHFAGGFCGAAFGFICGKKKQPKSSKKSDGFVDADLADFL